MLRQMNEIAFKLHNYRYNSLLLGISLVKIRRCTGNSKQYVLSSKELRSDKDFVKFLDFVCFSHLLEMIASYFTLQHTIYSAALFSCSSLRPEQKRVYLGSQDAVTHA